MWGLQSLCKVPLLPTSTGREVELMEGRSHCGRKVQISIQESFGESKQIYRQRNTDRSLELGGPGQGHTALGLQMALLPEAAPTPTP